jgi:hypothetical protein
LARPIIIPDAMELSTRARRGNSAGPVMIDRVFRRLGGAGIIDRILLTITITTMAVAAALVITMLVTGQKL